MVVIWPTDLPASLPPVNTVYACCRLFYCLKFILQWIPYLMLLFMQCTYWITICFHFRNILDDPEASKNDRFVALTLLKNANIAAGMVLPGYQDTGVCVCVCACACVCMCVCMCACICECMCVCVHTCVYVCMCECMCTYVCAHVCTYSCMYACMHVCVCVLSVM